MKENRAREKQLLIRMDAQEYEAFEKRFRESGVASKRDFVIEMCLKGYLVKVDLSALNKVADEINKIGVNINQIAHRVNSSDALFPSDLQTLMRDMNDINCIISREFIKYRK